MRNTLALHELYRIRRHGQQLENQYTREPINEELLLSDKYYVHMRIENAWSVQHVGCICTARVISVARDTISREIRLEHSTTKISTR